MSSYIHFEPITDKNMPLHPIQDMVNQIRDYRAAHSEAAWDWILKGFIHDHMDDLKEGSVEFATTKVCVLPDGNDFIYNHENMVNLIMRAEYWGIDLTYKTNPFDSEQIVWVMDIKE